MKLGPSFLQRIDKRIEQLTETTHFTLSLQEGLSK